MKLRDTILALFIIIVWGVNFTVIKFGVDGIPPLLLVALRFTFAAFPALLFIKPPQIPWQYVAAYGLTVGVGQFACLFYAIFIGMPAGVASVVLQAQAFFTIFLAALCCGERIKPKQFVGLALAFFGLICISGKLVGSDVSAIPFNAFLITICGAFFWASSNIVVQKAAVRAITDKKKLDVLSLVVWSSLVPPIPMLIMSVWLETPAVIVPALLHISGLTIFSIAYLSFVATLFGYGMWSKLLAKYPAQKIAPLSLLIPIVGIITAWLILGEKLNFWQWSGSALIIIGLMVSNLNVSRRKA